MKKFILVILTVFLTVLNAKATTITKYGMTGQPIAVSFGGGPYINYNSLRNSVNPYYNYSNRMPYYNPRYRHRLARPNVIRRYGYYNQPYGAVPVVPVVQEQQITTTTKPMSRLNRDYVISSPQKTHTENGITYFN